MLIFDRCHRSSDAVEPVKGKCDSNNLGGTLAKSKILFTEKFTKGAFKLMLINGLNQIVGKILLSCFLFYIV